MSRFLLRLAPVLGVAALGAQDAPDALVERAPRTALERAIAGALPAVVKVFGASGVSTIKPYATGVLVSPQGHVLTLDLVILEKDRTRVVLADGSVHEAEVLPPDDTYGVRMLKIGVDRELPYLKPADTDGLRPGTFVFSLGNSFRLAEYSEKVSAMFGVLVARARTDLRYRRSDLDRDHEILITDAPNNPGGEGGGLFTRDGAWIGLNMRVVESTETNTQLSAAIPTSLLRPYIERIVAGGPATTPITEQPAAPEPVAHGIRLFDRGGRRSPPAYVERVQRGSPAADLGLRPDDLIVRIDDWPVRSCDEFREVLARYRPGDEIEVTYKRGTKVHRGKMTLEAR